MSRPCLERYCCSIEREYFSKKKEFTRDVIYVCALYSMHYIRTLLVDTGKEEGIFLSLAGTR